MPKGVYDRTTAKPRGGVAHAPRAIGTIPCTEQGCTRMFHNRSALAIHKAFSHGIHSPRKAKLLQEKKSFAELSAEDIAAMPASTRNGNGRHEHEPPARKSNRGGKHGPRTRWTAEEWEKLRQAVMVRWRKHPEQGIQPLTFDEAQKLTLPPDRWRSLATIASVEVIYERCVEEAKAITAGDTARLEPEVRIVEKIIEKYATPEQVLANMSFPRLAGIFAAREAEELAEHRHRIETATATGRLPERKAHRERAETLADLGMNDVKDVRTLYPKVCVVGFSDHATQILRDRLGRHPISIFHQIKSNVPATESALPLTSADYFVIDDGQSPEDWKTLMQRLVQHNKIPSAKYIKAYNLERIRNSLAEIAAEWLNKNPELAKLHGVLWAGH